MDVSLDDRTYSLHNKENSVRTILKSRIARLDNYRKSNLLL